MISTKTPHNSLAVGYEYAEALVQLRGLTAQQIQHVHEPDGTAWDALVSERESLLQRLAELRKVLREIPRQQEASLGDDSEWPRCLAVIQQESEAVAMLDATLRQTLEDRYHHLREQMLRVRERECQFQTYTEHCVQS